MSDPVRPLSSSLDEGALLRSEPGRFSGSAPDPWKNLRQFTSARIALGRAGGSARTDTILDFRLSHARARDAVLTPFHPEALAAQLSNSGWETCLLATSAHDRPTFLLRPDLGRKLSVDARKTLEQRRAEWGQRDLALIVSDGLSALAAERQVGPTIAALRPLLQAGGWTLFPLFLVPFGRVKVQDEIGELLGARHALMLLGERPGLGSPDSLGAYFTYQPRGDRSDADRNCVSNIRPEGLPPEAAARQLAELLFASAAARVSGVRLNGLNPARSLDRLPEMAE